MKKIFLIRHGQTDWNVQMRFQGREDVPLNAEGKKQALQLSCHLADEKFAAFFTSPLSRAVETARIVAAKHDLTPCPIDGLKEIDFGRWEGLTYDEMNEDERVHLNRWFLDPNSSPPPEGESFGQFRERICQSYLRILKMVPKAPPETKIGIVTHAGAIKALVASVLQIPWDKLARLKISQNSFTIIQYDDWDNPYLELFNDTSHLKPDP
jgi:alpha-ribazole phosphatase